MTIFILRWRDDRVGHNQTLYFKNKLNMINFMREHKINSLMHKCEMTSFYDK